MKQHEQASGLDALAGFTTALATGAIRIVDLTLTLGPDFPSIVMPPERRTTNSIWVESFFICV